jgi:hypothetical protein
MPVTSGQSLDWTEDWLVLVETFTGDDGNTLARAAART